MTVQFIASRRPGKPVTWYVYAWRGGPLILKHVGPRKPALGAKEHAAIAAAMADARAIPPDTFRALIRDWCSVDPRKPGSPEWEALADSTKRVWRGHVDLIEERWGKAPIAVWNDPRMVAKVVKWRDERAATPRSADIGITVLAAMLEHARLRGRITINVARDIPTLYRGGQREEIVWTADEVARFEAAAIKEERPWITHGLSLARLTGLRLADLVTLTFDHVGEFAVSKTALKKSRGRRRRATIPMTPDLSAFLEEMRHVARKPGVETILVTSQGRPWSAGGFGGSFNRVRDLAGIVHASEEVDNGRLATTTRKKHLHDVRGTFCTMLLTQCDLTDREAADIMGWSPERVGNIRRVYVDQHQVVVALGKRIAAKQIAKQSGDAG